MPLGLSRTWLSVGESRVEDMFEGEVSEIGQQLLGSEGEPCGAAGQIDRISGWERLIAHAQAQQLAEMAAFATRRRTGGWADVPEDSREVVYDGANDEIALARGLSSATVALHVSLAQILTNDLPRCFAALDAGEIGLHAARVIVAETDVLTAEQRASIDEAVALEAARLTPGQVRDAVRARVLAVDAEAAAKRAAKERSGTCVGMVKRPDGVGMVYAKLTAEDAVATVDALDAHARGLRAAGDPRSLQQLRVDTFVGRLTGTDPARGAEQRPDQASQHAPARRRVQVNVVVSAATLLGLDDTPGMLTGYGAISPEVVREIVDGPDTWVRRLVVDPIDGEVLSIDSRARKIDGLLRTFTTARDGVCRRPWCANPIRHGDHIRLHATGGRTNHRNADGLCEPCHLSRHRHGWRLDPEPGSARVWWTTPTGHQYASDPPPAIGYGTLSHQLLRMIAQHPGHHPHRRRPAA